MGKTKLSIPNTDKYLFKQTIEISDSKREINILVGIGMLNSNDELSINIPLDFLLIIESLKTIKKLLKEKNKQLHITIWFGDKNAEILLKEKAKFTEENKKIWDSTKEIYKKKIIKILVNSGFDENKIDYFYGSDLYNEKEYRAYCENLSKTTKFGDDITSYSIEQLYVMHYFKNKLDYDLRLSWAKKYKPNKNCNDRDEEGIDKQYEETFNEKPITSIYFKHGLKLSDCEGGLGIAVPYSYFPSEINRRIPFDSNITLEQIEDFFDSLNEKSSKKFEALFTNGKKNGESSAEYILHKIIVLLK